MGVSGTAIFSDDTACDVRDEYRDHVGDGLTGPEATDAILQDWENQVDEQEMGVVWLALAATQWKCGRLEERVKQQALRIIDSGSDLERWEDDQKLIKKRKAALEKLRQQLLVPQPPVRRIAKRYRESCDWKLGELIAYRLLSGNWIVFRVYDYHTDRGGTSPKCEILASVTPSIPPEAELRKLEVLRSKEARQEGRPISIMLGRVSEKELPVGRIVRTGIITYRPRPMVRHAETGIIAEHPSVRHALTAVVLWRYLDHNLKERFEIA
jgi:hypothetical protein